SMVQPAICGLKITLSIAKSSFKELGKLSESNKVSNEPFSNSKTSRPAPRIFPDFNAETKSAVTTLLPRAVFINQKDFENEAIKSAFTILSVNGVHGV